MKRESEQDTHTGEKIMCLRKTGFTARTTVSLSGEHGSTLIVFLVILAVLATIAAGTMTAINLNYQAAGAHKKGNEGYYAAETALDVGAGRILFEFENLSEYTDSTAFGGDGEGWVDVTVADVGFDEINGYTMKYKVTQESSRFFYQTQTGPNVLSHYAYEFEIQGRATATDGSAATETLKETIRVLQTPLVQYFLFFGGTGPAADLELNSGPPQNSWGRIHTNGDLYYGAQTSFNYRDYDMNSLTSPMSWTVVGNMYQMWKPGGYSGSLNPILMKTESNGNGAMTPATNISGTFLGTSASDKATLESTFNGYIQIGVPIKKAPGRTQFIRGGFYEQRAGDPERTTVHGLKIVGQGALVAAGTGIQVFASQPAPNTDVTALIANGESSSGTPIPNFLVPVQERSNAFWDCREGDRVSVTDIDLYALETWYQAYLDDLGVSWPGDGLLIYASRSPDASFANDVSGVLQAIRFRVIDAVNGSLPGTLDETTVATDNPYYVYGDFNTNAPTHGVAIVGDAYNVLSNSWNDATKLCNGTRSPNPSQTTHNLAAFSGIVPTGGGVFSGAFINYPRFHECWDDTPCGRSSGNGIPMNINGALINLWTSTQGSSRWQLSSHFYNAPQRNYGWDVNFDNPEYWPPFVPAIYSMERDSFVE